MKNLTNKQTNKQTNKDISEKNKIEKMKKF